MDKQDQTVCDCSSGSRLGLLGLTVVTRLPSLLHPQPIFNEAIYSVVANEIVDGGRRYVDAVERKPPLLFWTYAAIFEVAGKYNWKALHVAALVWTLGTMAGLYAIGRALFDRETGLIAALLYSIFQPWVRGLNLAFNGELLMNLPIVWGWVIAFRPSSSRARPELVFSGALLCAAFLLKQPAAIAAVPFWNLFAAAGLSQEPRLEWNASGHSRGVAHARIFRNPRRRRVRPLATRNFARGVRSHVYR